MGYSWVFIYFFQKNRVTPFFSCFSNIDSRIHITIPVFLTNQLQSRHSILALCARDVSCTTFTERKRTSGKATSPFHRIKE